MFRVPRRTSAAPVVAPPDRTTWHGPPTAKPETPLGRAATPISAPQSAFDRIRIAPWESFQAPWGELEPIPYVVVTTQPWPEEWWRPNGSGPHTVAAGPHAGTAGPDTRSDGRNIASTRPVPRQIAVIPIERGAAVPRAAPPVGERRAPDHPARRTAAATTNAAARRRRDAEARAARRRGTLTRLAIFAVGLVISLIAVETAARRRG